MGATDIRNRGRYHDPVAIQQEFEDVKQQIEIIRQLNDESGLDESDLDAFAIALQIDALDDRITALEGASTTVVVSNQVVSVTVTTNTGTHTAAITAVTLAKSVIIPLSFMTANGQPLFNWDFSSVTRIQVETNTVGPGGASPTTAKAIVLEYA